MKLHILSDLHLEFGDMQNYNVPECDVVVLAGDIHVGAEGINWIMDTYKSVPVIYVLGNHEYYRKRISLSDGAEYISELAKESDNVHFLNNESVEIGDYLFVGGTLWTDYNLHGNQPYAGETASSFLADFSQIKYNPSFSRVDFRDFLNEHMKTRSFIENEIRMNNGKKKMIVVTHHLPSEKCINKKYKGEDANHALNASFASNLDKLVTADGVKMWIHGHTHDSVNCHIGDTWVLCNPRGCRGFTNSEFDQKFVVEI